MWGDVAGTTDLGKKNAFLLESNGTFHYGYCGIGCYGGETAGYGVNDRKNLVGYIIGPSVGESTASIWDLSGVWTNANPRGQWSIATGASPAGEWVSEVSNDVGSEFILYQTTTHARITPADGCLQPDLFDYGEGQAVNDFGVSVGSSVCYLVGWTPVAVMWANGIAYDLGAPPSRAYAISNESWLEAWIVGWTGHWDAERAFLANVGCQAFVDLNTLLDSASNGWTIIEAFGINRSHQIVGQGIDSKGQKRAILLTPNGMPLC